MASAAGLPVLLDTVAAEYRRQGSDEVGWPLLRWWQALGTDPLTRLRLADDNDARLRQLTKASLATPSPAQRERVDLAVREVANAAAGVLPPRWAESVRTATAPDADDLAGALDDAVGSVDLTVRRAWWWVAVRGLQYLLAAAAVVGFLWLALVGILRFAAGSRPSVPYVLGIPLPTLLFAGGIVGGALLGVLGVWLVRRGAHRRRRQAVEELRSAIGEVAWGRVVAPVAAVLEDHRAAREAIAGAF
jgi:hypothetical protein